MSFKFGDTNKNHQTAKLKWPKYLGYIVWYSCTYGTAGTCGTVGTYGKAGTCGTAVPYYQLYHMYHILVAIALHVHSSYIYFIFL